MPFTSPLPFSQPLIAQFPLAPCWPTALEADVVNLGPDSSSMEISLFMSQSCLFDNIVLSRITFCHDDTHNWYCANDLSSIITVGNERILWSLHFKKFSRAKRIFLINHLTSESICRYVWLHVYDCVCLAVLMWEENRGKREGERELQAEQHEPASALDYISKAWGSEKVSESDTGSI